MPAKKLKTQNLKLKTTTQKSKVTRTVIPNAKDKIVSRREARHSVLSVPLYSLLGRQTGTLDLPKEIFGAKVNKKLLSQAVRVYTTNQKSLLGSTKTRGEVEGSTVKIYRQKGTGRARHGSVRAPIFVGGGIVFGPQPRKVRLTLPKKMKKAALLSALSSKVSEKAVVGVTGFNEASGKTKEIVNLLDKVNGGKGALIVISDKMDNVIRATHNIPDTDVSPVNQLNAFEVLRHQFLVISKEALEKLK
ncbi:50S ribosomal protein L4 [Candidatus Daviesbacteria bacterium]|nr:50S ribosomal protein L4 [Candidatus Daviesbacteria bacterium]